jgi:Zn-dependent alcohol dehydrogenase
VSPVLGLGIFATETVVPVTPVVRIPSEIPLTLAALIGMGGLGVSAVTRSVIEH